MVVTAATLELQPFGNGEATCDDKWRLRLSINYARYLAVLGRDGESNTVKLFAATLDATTALVWPKIYLLRWREWLLDTANADPRRARSLLLSLQMNGGECELDAQNRMLLPRAVREALKLDSPPKNFMLFNEGAIRMVQHSHVSNLLSNHDDDSLDAYAVSAYYRFLSSLGSPGSVS